MFGVSFGELVLLMIIAVVVIGPRNLPTMMRSLGRTVAKIKRMTVDLREQSGIDEILRAEGIEREVQELRKLATGHLMDVDLNFTEGPDPYSLPPRSREYPSAGPDAEAFGAVFPDDPYAEVVSRGTERRPLLPDMGEEPGLFEPAAPKPVADAAPSALEPAAPKAEAPPAAAPPAEPS